MRRTPLQLIISLITFIPSKCFILGTDLFRPGVSTVLKDDPDAFESKDVIIHLSGRGILSWPFRFTKAQKAALRSSRVDSTQELVQILSKLKNPPKVSN